jgi:uncharacterized membrane protein
MNTFIKEKPSRLAIDTLITVGFIATAIAIRFLHLEEQSLWNDEMFSFDVALTPLSGIQTKLIALYHHPPLFFYLAHMAIAWFGQTAWALRFTSAVFGSLTVGLLYVVGNKLFNRSVGIIAALVCLAAPFHLAYSQEGRPYALAAFLCLFCTYFFIRFLQEEKKTHLIGYALSLTAMLYTHHWGVFLFATQVVYALLFSRSAPHGKKMLFLVWLLVGAAYIPEAYALFQQTTTHDPSVWFWVQSPGIIELWWMSLAYSGTYFKMASSIFELSSALQWTGGITVLVLFFASFFTSVAQRKAFRPIILCFIGMIILPFFLSFVKPEVFLWYRYTVIVFPLFCIVLAVGMEKLKVIGWILVSVWISMNVVGVMHYFSWQKSSAKDVAIFVDEVTQKDTVRMIIRPKQFAPLMNYYYKGKAIEYDEAYLETPLGEIVDTAASFVYVSLDVQNTIRDYMDGHFDKIVEKKFSGEAHMGMRVGVYKQKPDM